MVVVGEFLHGGEFVTCLMRDSDLCGFADDEMGFDIFDIAQNFEKADSQDCATRAGDADGKFFHTDMATVDSASRPLCLRILSCKSSII